MPWGRGDKINQAEPTHAGDELRLAAAALIGSLANLADTCNELVAVEVAAARKEHADGP